MENPMLSNEIKSDRIRKEEIEGEIYYSVIDIVGELLDADYKRAQAYYHTLKKRLKQEGNETINLWQMKTVAVDGKSRLTDFTNLQGIETLLALIQPRKRKKHIRVNIRKDDEVIIFHQEIINRLCDSWIIEHHTQLSSDAEIDILARSKARPSEIMLIECKPHLSRQKFYTAIGQVFAYQAEFSQPSIPAIAAYSSFISPYMRDTCEKLQIRLIAIEKS